MPVSYLKSRADPAIAPAASIRRFGTRPANTGSSNAEPARFRKDTGVMASPNSLIAKSQRMVIIEMTTATDLRP